MGGLKAAKIAETAAPEDIVVAADTIVVVDGAVLGKPHDEEEAFHMLKTLSGRGHEVMTGLNVWHEGKLRQEVVRTRVHFRPMTDAEIRANLKQYMGKATVILISHRITTLMAADQILVLDDGRLAGIGTHESLLADCPVYQEICRSQLKKEDAE